MNLKIYFTLILFSTLIAFSGCSKDEDEPTPTVTTPTPTVNPYQVIDFENGTISLTIDSDVYNPYGIDCWYSTGSGQLQIVFNFDQNGSQRIAVMTFNVPTQTPGIYSLHAANIVVTPSEQTASLQEESIELTTINSSAIKGSFYIISDQGSHIYGDIDITN